MPDTGWRLGGLAISVNDGDEAWATPENVLVDSATSAACLNLPTGGLTGRLIVTDFNWGVPIKGEITGIGLRYRIRANNNTDMLDESIFLFSGGSVVGTPQYSDAFYSSTNELRELGGEGVLWGVTPTAGTVVAPGFGCAIRCQDGGSGSGDDVWIEAVWMKIFFKSSYREQIQYS